MNSDKTKVLILCNDFPPVNSIGADRPYSWYNYFREFNIYPVIITKNWISDGNTQFNKIGVERDIKNTDLGCIIKTSKVITPSLWFHEKFGNKFSILEKHYPLPKNSYHSIFCNWINIRDFTEKHMII